MTVDSRINNDRPFDPFGVIVLNTGSIIPVRGGTVFLAFGPTVTSPPVKLPALTASAVLVQGTYNSGVPCAWALDASAAPPAAFPAAYSTAGAAGTPGDYVNNSLPQLVPLSAAQQALLTAGNLCLSAVTTSGASGTLSITFGQQA